MGVFRPDLDDHRVPYPDEFAEQYREAGLWESTTVGERLHEVATDFPQQVAVASIEGRLTYEELDNLSDRLAAGLLDVGLEPGDRVLFQVGNVPETVTVYYGVLKAGLVPVCSIPQHREKEMSYLADHTEARAYIVQADYEAGDLAGLAWAIASEQNQLEFLLAIRGEPEGFVSVEQMIEGEDTRAARSTVEGLDLQPEAVGILQLSGGTTGVPKVIPRLHTEYIYNSRAFAEAWGWDSSNVLMHTLPLIHNAGTVAAIQPAHLVGATFVLSPSANPAKFVPLIESESVTDVPVVPPAILIRLLDYEDRDDYDLSSLKRFVIGGQKLPPEFADAIEDELGLPCLQMFGMGEGMLTRTTADAPEWIRKNTVGNPISPFDEVKILEPGTEDEVEPGELGEFCARGPYTIRGYFKAPDHNRRAFTSDGFYRTGDLAQQHILAGNAYLSIEGRIKDVINRGAEKINAEEVEDLLVEHPAIHSAILVAMPDRELGERPCVYVILEPEVVDLGLHEVHQFLFDQGLAKFKYPERVEIVDEFPLTNVGKVSKKELREDIRKKLENEEAGA